MSTIAEKVDAFLNQDYPGCESSIYRDLSLNLKKLLEEGNLDPKERFMNLMAIATALGNSSMMKLAKELLQSEGLSDLEIQESTEIAGIMGMNNVYYKFKSFLSPEVRESYTRAGLRMQSMMKPQTGKQNFEMMSLAVSVVNGCPTCVSSHEKAVRDLGVSVEKIHDIARLAAVGKGLTSLKTARGLYG